MLKSEKNEEIEERIADQVVVDAYGQEERYTGWFYYLTDKIHFPFEAKCIAKSKISPLNIDEIVKVLDTIYQEFMILVKIEWQGRKFGVPLEQLEGVNIDDDTKEAIDDWHYWVKRGYLF